MLKNELNVMLNSISLNEDDPTIINCKFTILDFEVSRNNVIVGKEEALQLGQTIKGKPIRTLYKEETTTGSKDDDFGDHEAQMGIDRNGNAYMKRNTVPIGVFTSDGYIEQINVDGVMKDVLVADAHLWYSQFKEPIQLIIEWFEQGMDINMSCEYLYSNYEVKDKIEYHYSPLYLESHVLLGSKVTPAYESAKLLQFNQLEEFSLAVAQALNNKNKEVNDLAEVVQANEEINEEKSKEIVEETVEEKTEEIVDETVEKEEETDGEEVNKGLQEVKGLQEKVETDEVAQLNAKIEELNNEISQLNTKVEELTNSKSELSSKFESATETISQLNAQLEELKPFKEQLELVQKETALNEAKELFEAKFNAIGANELFASEEIQNLVAQSIEDGEVGLNAKLSLNEKIVELASKKLEANANPIQAIMNSSASRDFNDLIDNDTDPLSEYRS